MIETTFDLMVELLADPMQAHQILFQSRHPNITPHFHKELISLLHSDHTRVLALCFRGSGKSSLAEECITFLAASAQVHNVLIVAESWLRACDRLRAIRRELETNEWLIEMFGNQLGDTWQESRLILNNGVAITAHGAGQALRGTKHLIYRPDFCFVDDLESAESVATEDARRKLSDWFYSDLIPALDPDYRIRVAATPLHPESLAVSLSRAEDWRSQTVPIEYIDEDGARRSSWPDRFPLVRIDAEKRSYVIAGKQHKYAQEYMMQAISPEAQMFREAMFQFELVTRTNEPVYVAIDPARTVKETSATTGVVVGSWVGRRLIIWEARPYRITPAEIIDLIFRLEQKYRPIAIGIERDGLEEFLLQPIRHEQIRRATLLPIKALRAPRGQGKLEFIGRLQPLFQAGDVTFAGDRENFGDAISQFLGFPSGFVDVPNACAFLFEMRGGIPVYEDAGLHNLTSHIYSRPGAFMLAVNAGSFGTAAVLFQYAARVLWVYKDWVSEADAGQSLSSFIEEARMFANRPVQCVAPPFHFDAKNSFGLLASLRGVTELRRAGDPVRGREVIRDLLRTQMQGNPRLLIGPEASWTARALLGGHVKEVGKAEPKDSLYATLMTGLEAALAQTKLEAGPHQAIAYTPTGAAYQTAEVGRR
jgi:hypothetical protein